MRRLLASLAVVAVPVAVTVPLVLSWRDRLPAQLAVHWMSGDRPDGFSGRDGFLDGWAVASVAVLAVGIGIVLLLRRRGRRTAVTLLGVGTGFLAALGLMVALPNLDVTDPAAARVSWEAALPLALMAVVAGLAWWLHGPADEAVKEATAPPPAELPRIAPGEPAQYEDSGVQWVLAIGTFVLMGGLGAVMWALISPWLGIELILAGLLLATFGWIRIRVPDGGDLVLTGGPIGHRVPLAEVTGAEVRESVDPFGEFGGWGLRYRPGTVALVHRRGAGVEIGRTDGRKVVVTCADPHRLAAVINTLADQRFPLATR